MNNNFSKDSSKWARRVEASLDTVDRNIRSSSSWNDSASSSLSATQDRLFRLAGQTKGASQRVLERGQYLDSVLSARVNSNFGPLGNAATPDGVVTRMSQLPPNSPSGKYLVNLDFSVAYCILAVRVQGITIDTPWLLDIPTNIILSGYSDPSAVGSFRVAWEIPASTPVEVLQYAYEPDGIHDPKINYLNLSIRGIL